MGRYFLEVAYDGSAHSGFQVQENAATIQGEINRSLETILKENITTYGASRTDAGVHAHQNFLHLDLETPIPRERIYNINAVLPPSIVLKNIYPVVPEAHARFSALSRTYIYTLYTVKNPFLRPYGYFFPYTVDWALMEEATYLLLSTGDFEAFSKRNTQVHTYSCDITEASWRQKEDRIEFRVTSNRFLRGMVRGLVATLLNVGRKKISVEDFKKILRKEKGFKADFSAPGKGLSLIKIAYPERIFLDNKFFS